MKVRRFWLEKVESAWRRRSVLWLSGVRRAGKTCLSRSIPDVEYFDCELPRVRRMMDDPETFLDDLRSRRIVLDEVHRLANPSDWSGDTSVEFVNLRGLIARLAIRHGIVEA